MYKEIAGSLWEKDNVKKLSSKDLFDSCHHELLHHNNLILEALQTEKQVHQNPYTKMEDLEKIFKNLTVKMKM